MKDMKCRVLGDPGQNFRIISKVSFRNNKGDVYFETG